MTYICHLGMLLLMRTTVRLPEDLFRRAKAHAAEAGITFTQLLEDALRLAIREQDRAADQPGRYDIHPLPAGRGLQPGVDLDDQAALLDLMDDT